MDLPKRKRTRLLGYDYSQNGAYFITICTHEHKQILSKIRVGAIHESPELILTHYGKIVEQIIKSLPDRFDISVDKYVIMPNHIHLIISIFNQQERAIHELPLHSRSTISNAIGYLKMNVSKEIHKTNCNKKVWQRSFHDHIIRNEHDYEEIWQYIDNNPLKWESDCFYCEK